MGSFRSELLVQHGFIKGGKKDNYELNKESGKWEAKSGQKFKDSDADEEYKEVNFGGEFDHTGFPNPVKSYRLSLEMFDLSLEGPYFWVVEDLQQKYTIVEKLEDSFAASENSAFFGASQQRLGAQQDKVSQFLATTGKMIKELFQMVRELRILDERIVYYSKAEAERSKPITQRHKGEEITLKGMFVDLVQGGGKSAASIYGMARELEFITLPDLFFDAPPFSTQAEMEQYVNSLSKDFNENVVRVLRRHLTQFMIWKVRTYKEHRDRRGFMKQYLRQHFEIIQMYIEWIKPYLRHVKGLHMKTDQLDSPELVSAFEGTMLDIEVLGRRRIAVGDDDGANGCALITFNYRTRPEMKVVSEGYQRGPVHIGRVDIGMRVYAWNDAQVQAYKDLKKAESMKLMGDVSKSVKDAMDQLGDELTKYLNEGKEEKKTEVPEKTMMQRFLGDFYTPKKVSSMKPKGSKRDAEAQKAKLGGQLKGVSAYAHAMTWLTYKNFKKAHRMVMW